MNQKKTDLPHSSGNGNFAQGSRVAPEDWKLRPVYRLAEQYCANFCRGGLCLGVDFKPDGSPFMFRKGGCPCLLQAGERCPYFETAVLPMEKRDKWPTPAQGKAFAEGARLYHLAFPETVVAQPETRKCPDCGKRRIEPRKRCCAECRKRRRKATNAANQRKWRKARGDRNTVNQNGSSLGAVSQGTILKPAILHQATPFSGFNLWTASRQEKEVSA